MVLVMTMTLEQEAEYLWRGQVVLFALKGETAVLNSMAAK